MTPQKPLAASSGPPPENETAMEFLKVPVICKTSSAGLYAEGAPADGPGISKEDLVTFEHAVENYGHLLKRNQTMTGAQWSVAIASTDDAAQPRVKAVLDAIRRVMLCDEFEDDRIVLDGAGGAVFRGSAVECDSFKRGRDYAGVVSLCSCTPEQFDQARISMATRQLVDYEAADAIRPLSREEGTAATGNYLGTAFDLPPGYGLSLSDQPRDSLLRRIHELLGCAAIGPETLTEAQSDDTEAQLHLVLLLARNLGYESLVTAKLPGMRWKGNVAGEPPWNDVSTNAAVHKQVASFFRNLVDAGWEPGKSVYFCRPAPIGNPIASIRPFESLVHSRLIGWRLPRAMVERYSELARGEAFTVRDGLRERGAA